MGVINCQSARNKSEPIKQHIKDHDLDIVALTETWFHQGNVDTKKIKEVTPTGYKLKHIPRKTRGGGVAIIYRETVPVTEPENMSTSSFEGLTICVHSGSISVKLVVIYRIIPSKKKNRLSRQDFC